MACKIALLRLVTFLFRLKVKVFTDVDLGWVSSNSQTTRMVNSGNLAKNPKNYADHIVDLAQACFQTTVNEHNTACEKKLGKERRSERGKKLVTLGHL